MVFDLGASAHSGLGDRTNFGMGNNKGAPLTAVLAEFVDCRPVKSRSVLQLILEVPIEQADKAVISLGGFPLPGESRWVGVALAPKERPKPEPETDDQKKRRQFDSLQPSAQAAILCTDPEFVEFLESHDMPAIVKDPASMVRWLCTVETRAQFNTDHTAKNRWDVLRSQFKQWQVDRRYEQSVNR